MTGKDGVSMEIREYMAKLGRKGGSVRKKKLTPERRAEIARKAAQARWAKAKGKKGA